MLAYKKAAGAVLRATEADMQHIVQGVARNLDDWLKTRVQIAQTLARNPLVVEVCESGDYQRLEKMFTEIHEDHGVYEAVFVANAVGVIQVASIPPAVGIDVRALPEYNVNIESAIQGKSWIGDAFASPASGRPVSLITVPVVKEGTVIGIVGTPLELNAFSERNVSAITIGETGNVAIIDKKGITLAHQKKDYILKVDLSKMDFGKQVLAQKTGLVKYDWEGQAKLAVFEESPLTGWIVLALTTQSEFMGPIRSIGWYVAAAALLGLLAISAFVYFFSQRLAGSIKQGLDFARAVAEGDLSRQMEVRSQDEIGQMTKALNTMVQRMGEIIGSIQESSVQLASSSEQLSASAENLSQGATEQAANLEQTSASIEELLSMT